ncbi:unnamed protein product, partial [marine sediment metagenome]
NQSGNLKWLAGSDAVLTLTTGGRLGVGITNPVVEGHFAGSIKCETNWFVGGPGEAWQMYVYATTTRFYKVWINPGKTNEIYSEIPSP